MTDAPPRASLWLQIPYWLATGIVVLLLVWASVMYVALPDVAAGFFAQFGYPAYLIYPLAALKFLALLVIILHRWNDLRDMAYAAYFLNMAMALTAHIVHGDVFAHALVGMIAVPVSYLLGNRVRGRPRHNFFARFAGAA